MRGEALAMQSTLDPRHGSPTPQPTPRPVYVLSTQQYATLPPPIPRIHPSNSRKSPIFDGHFRLEDLRHVVPDPQQILNGYTAIMAYRPVSSPTPTEAERQTELRLLDMSSALLRATCDFTMLRASNVPQGPPKPTSWSVREAMSTFEVRKEDAEGR